MGVEKGPSQTLLGVTAKQVYFLLHSCCATWKYAFKLKKNFFPPPNLFLSDRPTSDWSGVPKGCSRMFITASLNSEKLKQAKHSTLMLWFPK